MMLKSNVYNENILQKVWLHCANRCGKNQSKRYNSNMFGKTENMQSTHLKGNKSLIG
jgi:hypothetical protein